MLYDIPRNLNVQGLELGSVILTGGVRVVFSVVVLTVVVVVEAEIFVLDETVELVSGLVVTAVVPGVVDVSDGK